MDETRQPLPVTTGKNSGRPWRPLHLTTLAMGGNVPSRPGGNLAFWVLEFKVLGFGVWFWGAEPRVGFDDQNVPVQ